MENNKTPRFLLIDLSLDLIIAASDKFSEIFKKWLQRPISQDFYIYDNILKQKLFYNLEALPFWLNQMKQIEQSKLNEINPKAR